MTTVAECLELIAECGKEMRRNTKTVEQVHASQMCEDFSHEVENEASTENTAYYTREGWHKADAKDGSGVFQEIISEITTDNPELYALMLTEPQQFGVTLAGLFRQFANNTARKLAGQ